MHVIIDALASAYGWAKDAILDGVYFDEAWDYMRLISRRKFAEYKMMVAIHHNQPKETIDALVEQEKALFPQKSIKPENTGVDKTAFEAFKNVMRRNPHMVVK